MENIKKLNFGSIMFEVTRRCNLKCEHCLRGDAENVDMSKEVIDATLDNVELISFLKLTGGEPFLVPEIIEYLVDSIIQRDILIFAFSTVVNGTIFGERAIRSIDAINKLAKYIKEKNKNIKIDKIAEIIISDDHYHKNNVKEAIEIYNKYTNEYVEVIEMKEIDEYKKSNISPEIFSGDEGWICEGRAKENNIGLALEKYKDCHIGCHRCNLENEINCMIVITAKGNLAFESDLSFENEDKINMGNVMEKSIIEILIENEWNEPLTCGEISDTFKIINFINLVDSEKIDILNFPKEKVLKYYNYCNYLVDAMLLKRNALKKLHKEKPYLTYEECVDALDADFAIRSNGKYQELMSSYYGNYKLKYPEDWVYDEWEQQEICNKYKKLNFWRGIGINIPSPLNYKIKSCDATYVYDDEE